MTTMELDTLKMELFKAIMQTDDVEILDGMKHAFLRLTKKVGKAGEQLEPYTMEELNARIDRSLDDIENGRTSSSEDVYRRLEEKYNWLCE